ncbi:TRAP transporter small permease [Ruegeria sp. HKCCD8929]|uniref:TRAP transporter small permease n=1 Tax=Ruegeria sp. HKCCD8929 TaxID=2683006 RepID=UPI001C2C4340|nr:TRAP transporter small permease [Ruegeria sp. HKCCD8929]
MHIQNGIARVLEKLALACASLAAVGVVTIIGFIATSVVLRKFANAPLHMTEEVVGLLLSVSLLLGLPMVTLRSEHVKVSLLISALGPVARKWVALAGVVLSLAFFGWLLVESYEWFEFAYRRNLKTLTSRILLYPWMAMLPLSLIICMLILLARIAGILPEPERRS